MKLIKLKDGTEAAVIEGDSHISKWVQESGRLDHDQSALPRILALIKPGDVVVDGGAFIGDHTVAYARAVGEAGRVFAFEPNPTAFECLRFNTGLLKNVTCFNYGLSDVFAEIRLHGSENAGATYAEYDDADPDTDVARIDRFVIGLDDRVDLIKLDIEGFEVRALKGAAETIRRCRPYLVVEVNEGALNRQGSTGAELLDLIRSYGYSVENLYPGGLLHGAQFDVIAKPIL
jgi:FkbM family methyltransferase